MTNMEGASSSVGLGSPGRRSPVCGVVPEEFALVDDDIEQLVDEGALHFGSGASELKTYIQPASVDIPAGNECYLVREKFLPFQRAVRDVLPKVLLEQRDLRDPDGVVMLKGQTYLVPCGRVKLPPHLRGSLSPKSSIGRIDMMVRIIFDSCGLYDTIPFGGEGELWMEVSPRSFNVRMVAGLALSQLMLFTRRASSPALRLMEKPGVDTCVYSREGEPVIPPNLHRGDVVLSLHVGASPDECIGYEAIATGETIDLRAIGAHAKEKYFRPIFAPQMETSPSRLTLEKDKFYILATKERVSVPVHLSAEMVPFSQHVGELRAHYAGFFDPGFGYGTKGEIKGTIGVLEVRPHETITIYDGQPICLMEFYRNSDVPRVPYGQAGNHYQSQSGPRLAKYFA